MNHIASTQLKRNLVVHNIKRLSNLFVSNSTWKRQVRDPQINHKENPMTESCTDQD
jgi:hypothetical protein